jgi:flagellar secretion chaperone FliS
MISNLVGAFMAVHNSKLAAYQSVAVHGGIAADDPHHLVLMLMDGIMQRISTARGCLARQDLSQKAQLLQRAVALIAELRGSLDHQQGGALAHNLDELYDYMARQLVRANAENRASLLDEVASLLSEIRSAWLAVPLALRAARPDR